MEGVGPFTFTGIRFLVGACVVFPLALRDWRGLAAQNRAPCRGEWLSIGLLGALLALGAVFQQIGLVSTTVTNAGFLTALYVPLVPMFSWLLMRVRPHW